MCQVISQNLAKANQTDKTVEIRLDIDSTVATVYGKQEGAEVRHNPKNFLSAYSSSGTSGKDRT